MIKGGCLCGKIRYEFKQEDVISAGNCHCKDCQKATGSGKATIVYIPSNSLKINEDYKSVISKTFTQTNYPIQYYFEFTGMVYSSFSPGFNSYLSNQPYHLIRQKKQI